MIFSQEYLLLSALQCTACRHSQCKADTCHKYCSQKLLDTPHHRQPLLTSLRRSSRQLRNSQNLWQSTVAALKK